MGLQHSRLLHVYSFRIILIAAWGCFFHDGRRNSHELSQSRAVMPYSGLTCSVRIFYWPGYRNRNSRNLHWSGYFPCWFLPQHQIRQFRIFIVDLVQTNTKSGLTFHNCNQWKDFVQEGGRSIFPLPISITVSSYKHPSRRSFLIAPRVN